MKKVAIFGSTGSIGTNTLKVIEENSTMFKIVTLVANKSVQKLEEQINKFKPKYVYIGSKADADRIKRQFKNVEVFFGNQGMEEISNLVDFDIAVSALVGISGLKPTFNMIKNGKTVALANKEVLVAGGDLIMQAVKKFGATLIPVDSEHSAILQCLKGEKKTAIDKILLTASGGPFLHKAINNDITVEDALNHPTWSMGNKVTIDSATMMNKGFEIIEAKLLFDISVEQIDVVVHPESLVHSMVQLKDGTIIANIGPKSMQIPISYALNYPTRLSNGLSKLDLFAIKSLNFLKPDLEKFKCLKLAYKAISMGHSFQVVLNAANEVCVEAFLNKQIRFIDISDIIEKFLTQHLSVKLRTIDDVLELDVKIKEAVRLFISDSFA